MQRREFLLSTLLLAFPALPAWAHTPYRQWDIFRKRHMQLLTSHSDLEGDKVADIWVEVLAETLPLSHALVSRARDINRVAALLKTNQAKLAILSYAHADAMFNGRAPFEEFNPMPLQVLLDTGDHVLVARDDLPLHHGYVVTAGLMEKSKSLGINVPLEGKFGMVVHPGAKAVALNETIEPPSVTP